VGIGWLSTVDTVILCSERVVPIPLPNDKILRVQGETPDSPNAQVFSAMLSKTKLENVIIIREFSDVFPDDLPGLSPFRQLDFRVKLDPNASPVAKTLYRLATTKM
jgi:hypothetical protein